jgi:hypothetical protein
MYFSCGHKRRPTSFLMHRLTARRLENRSNQHFIFLPMIIFIDILNLCNLIWHYIFTHRNAPPSKSSYFKSESRRTSKHRR